MATPQEMAQTMIRNLPEKTGKSLTQWIKVLGNQSLQKHGQIVTYLKKEHGITHGFANLIAHSYLSDAALPAADELVAAQYHGPKSELQPIYDAVLVMIKKFGKDVEVAPKKSYVSLRRNKQFALIQPSTRTRVDIGINLKGVPPKGRLEKSGSFNAMVSHRVKLSSKDEVNSELKRWLKQAYDAA